MDGKPNPQPVTAKDSVPVTVQPASRNGGALRVGNPGNRGGRGVTKTFTLRCQHLAEEAAKTVEAAKIVKDPTHPLFMEAAKWCADRGFGKAAQPITGADLGPIQTEDVSKVQAQLRHRLAHLMPSAN